MPRTTRCETPARSPASTTATNGRYCFGGRSDGVSPTSPSASLQIVRSRGAPKFLKGSTEDILSLVAELHSVPFDQGIPRVYTVLKLDERRDRPNQTLDDKVRAVEERLAADAS
jgi:hypothetical protein